MTLEEATDHQVEALNGMGDEIRRVIDRYFSEFHLPVSAIYGTLHGLSEEYFHKEFYRDAEPGEEEDE